MLLEKERGPYYLHNKSFGTISLAVIFPYKYKDEDFMTVRLVSDVINRSMTYKTKQEFKTELINNQIILLSSFFKSVEDTTYTRFELMIPNPKILKDTSLEKCIAFLADMIYNPFIENNGLEADEVTKFIDIYKKNIKERKHLIANYAMRRLFEISAPNTRLSSSMDSHQNQLDKITPQSLYNFYKQNIINNNPFVFVMGDVDENEVNRLIDKYIFKKKEPTIKISKKQNHFLSPNEFQGVTEEKNFFQSYISLVYKVKDMKEKDRYTLRAINSLLNNQSSFILFKKMRLENDLVYTCGAITKERYGFLALTALINRTSKEKAINTFNEVINLLKDEEYIKSLLDKIKNHERIEIIKDKDRKGLIFDDFIDETLEFFTGREMEYKKLCEITSKDIADMANRLVLDTQYFVRGNKDAK